MVCGRGASKWVLDEHFVGSQYAAYTLTYSATPAGRSTPAIGGTLSSSTTPQPPHGLWLLSWRVVAAAAVGAALVAYPGLLGVRRSPPPRRGRPAFSRRLAPP